jgi:hypothetical protein
MSATVSPFLVGWLLLLLGAVIHFALTLATLAGYGPYGRGLAARLQAGDQPEVRAFSRHIAMHVFIMGVAWWGLTYWGIRDGHWWAWLALLLMGLAHFAAFAWTETRREGSWHPPDWRWWGLLVAFVVSMALTAPVW